MAYNIPDGFELVDSNSNVPDGFELVGDTTSALPQGYELVGDQPGILSTLGQNTLGALTGAADIASGVVTSIPAWVKAQYDVAMGGDPAAERKEMGETISSMTPSAMFPSMRENPTYQMMMKPFELAEQGVDKAVEALGGGDAAKLAVMGPLMVAPLPFAKTLGRGMGKVLETVDPALRDSTPFKKPEPLMSHVEEPVMQESTSPGADVRWEESPPNPQMDIFEPINPYDVGGHVTNLREGRATTIDASQPELGGIAEDPRVVTQQLIDEVQAQKDAERMQEVQGAEQGDLFGPQTSMHRAYDQWGPDELPRQLSREEFEQTMRNLSEQEGTVFQMPEDIDAAYSQYLNDMEGRQGGLFDRPTQQAGFRDALFEESNARMAQSFKEDLVANHPDLVNLHKGIARLEDQLAKEEQRGWTKRAEATRAKLDVLNKRLNTRQTNLLENTAVPEMGMAPTNYSFADLRPGVDSIPGVTRETGAGVPIRDSDGMIPTKQSWNTPEARTQAVRDVSATIPGLDTFPVEKPATEVVKPSERTPNQTDTAVEKATGNIPGLGAEAQALIFENKTPEQVIESAKGDRDTKAGTLRRQLFSGANMASTITGSNLIKGIYNFMNTAEKAYNKVLKRDIIPIEREIVHLNKQEKIELSNALKEELFSRQKRAEPFANPKIQRAYEKLRQGLLDAGESLNRGRIAAGLEPVSLKEYYVSSRWRGNFKAAAYVDGKLVGYLREQSQRALNKSKAALEQQFKGVQWRDDTTTRSHAPSDTLEASFYDALKLLDQDDPIVQAFSKAIEDQLAGRGSSSLGMLFHAEQKGNVRGFLGDRPNVSEAKNAIDLLNSQLQYMKSTHKWAAQQEAVAKVKQVLADPDLQAAQPNNVAYAKDYVKNALGFGTVTEIRNIESFLSQKLGYDREAVMAALNNLRAYFYTTNLGLLNPKATLVQVAQPIFALPEHMAYVQAGFNYDPMIHYRDLTSDFAKLYSGRADKMTPEGKAAIQYAMDTGILSMNVLDEIRNLGDSNLKRGAVKVANINQIKVEEFGRAYTFLSAVHHLKQTKGLTGEPLYLTAEAFTNRVMSDYRRFEQPMWMEKGGLTSRAAGTLKTFVNNQYNQLLRFGKEAAKGNMSPLATYLGIQFALAGTLGMPGVETAMTLYDEFIRPLLGPKQADKGIKHAALENMNDFMKYGGFSAATGANMFGSLSQGTVAGAEDAMSFFLPFMSQIARQVAAGGKVLIDPTDSAKWRTLIYESAPPHLKGAMENLLPSLTSEQGFSLNPRDTTRGMYKRSDFDKALRYLGATSLEEFSTKERAWENQQQEMRITEAKSMLKDEYQSALKEGDRDTMKEVIETLSRWMGPDEIARFLIQGVKDQYTSRNQDVFGRQTPKSVKNLGSQLKYQRMQEMKQ